MSCNDSTKFVISKGSENTFVFTIKQDNSTLPLVIEAGDTFTASLILLGANTPYTQVTDKTLTVEDSANGKVTLVIPSADTVDLVVEVGAKVDRYYKKPTYKLVITCDTTNNGKFIAKVPEVYVD